jgi:RNA polymerase sigma-70 factor (ECF subfamily)
MGEVAPIDGRATDVDVELMLRARDGDLRSFEDLFRKYSRSLMNFVRRFVSSPAVAEELTQDIFLKVYRARASYEPRSKFSTFLYRVATNHCLNELRRGEHKGRFEAADAPGEDGEGRQLADAAPGAEDLVAAQQLSDAVEDALRALPESQRAALLLLRYQGMSYEDIAASMDLSVPAVKSLLNRAKTGLRERLAAHLGDEDELVRVQGKG